MIDRMMVVGRLYISMCYKLFLCTLLLRQMVVLLFCLVHCESAVVVLWKTAQRSSKPLLCSCSLYKIFTHTANKGNIGANSFVPCREVEVVPISEVK